MLLCKLIVGLSDKSMHRHVYQICDSITSIESLRTTCCSYEATCDDATAGQYWREPARAAGNEETKEAPPDIAATTASKGQQPRLCGNCDTSHTPMMASCPTKSATCHSCQNQGHFKRCCRSTNWTNTKAPTPDVLGTVTSAGNCLSCQSLVQVSVTHNRKGPAVSTAAVADTGAQVCIAGPSLMSELHLKPALLQTRAGL